jgi:formyl-CoA transferase
MSVTGWPDGPPTASGVDVGESGTGVQAALGILAAVIQRQQTGRGQRVDVAMQEATLNLTRTKFTSVLTTGEPMARIGNDSLEGGFVKTLRCAPGGPNDYVYVRIPPDSPTMFEQLVRAIGHEELLHDGRFNTSQARAEHQSALHAILESWTQRRDKHRVMETLARADVACGAVLDTQEVLDNPHLRARGMIEEVEHPRRGRYAMIGCPVRLSDSPADLKPAPLQGEHTTPILTRLAGCTPEEIERLRDIGAL